MSEKETLFPSTQYGILGTDGYTPIYNADARWEEWNYDEIFFGKEGKNKYVPKVDDYVYEVKTGLRYIVVDLDLNTLIPTLRVLGYEMVVNDSNIISSTEQNFRLYYDKTQQPYALAVDTMMRTHSFDAAYGRIYRGTTLTPDRVISQVFDNTGNFVGHDVNLTLVAMNSHDNFSVRSMPLCNCSVELQNGEMCTVVFFSHTGHVVGKAFCIVDETSYIPQAYSEQRYITNIYMKSVFIDGSESNTINFPINLTMDSFTPIGVVKYNDGTEVEYPVDGKKFSLYGIDVVGVKDDPVTNSFASTTIGHKIKVSLVYEMSEGEATINYVGYDNKSITRPYYLVVSEQNRAYGVKLFVYPYWIDEVSGYRLKYFLLNLDRDALYDVTPYVNLSPNSSPFIPTAYNTVQRMTFQINLREVSTSFGNYIHVQRVEVLLRAKATDDYNKNIWEVTTDVPSNVGLYGTNLKAKVSNKDHNLINISNDFETLDEWLEDMYNKTDPLVNRVTEDKPKRPTHFGVRYKNETIMVRVEDYKKDIKFVKEKIKLYDNVDIFFYLETVGSFLNLSVSNLTIRK